MTDYQNLFGTQPTWLLGDQTIVKDALHTAASAADKWIRDNSWHFTSLQDWPDNQQRQLHHRALTRLAAYLFATDSLGAKKACELFDLSIVDLINNAEFHSLLKRHPKMLLSYGPAINYIKYRGRLSRLSEQSIDSVLARRSVWAANISSHRLFDLWNFLSLYNEDHYPFDIEHVLSFSALRYQPDPIESSADEARAFSHALLSYYNFGMRGDTREIRRPDYDIEDTLCALVLRYCAENNFELVLELLFSAALHRQLPHWLLNYSLSFFAPEIAKYGFIQGRQSESQPFLADKNQVYQNWGKQHRTAILSAATFRYLWKNWREIDSHCRIKNLDINKANFTSLAQCGSCYRSLAAYSLRLGAIQTQFITKNSSPVTAPYLQRAVEFIRHQRNEDGSFGFWQEEKNRFCQKGGDKELFYREQVLPLSRLCDQLLRDNNSAR